MAIPILMGFWIRGRIPAESSNPLNRFLIRIYHPLLLKVLHWPKTTLLIALLSILTVVWPLNRVGGEFRRRSTRAICCICRPRCRGSPLRRRRICCRKPIS
nr:hypothetical protein [Klebsiella pneumoniae subsp. pneumoniae]